MTLTNSHTTDTISEQNGFTKIKSKEAVGTIMGIFKSTLASGNDALISGFGKFSVKVNRERRRRNSASSEDMMLTPRRVVTFNCSGKSKERINKPK